MFGSVIIRRPVLDGALASAKQTPGRFEGAFLPGEWVQLTGYKLNESSAPIEARIVSVTWIHGGAKPLYTLGFPIAGQPELFARCDTRISHDWLSQRGRPKLTVVSPKTITSNEETTADIIDIGQQLKGLDHCAACVIEGQEHTCYSNYARRLGRRLMRLIQRAAHIRAPGNH